ncbi:MAG: hypothetical protein M1814_006936 [Vezdaea aestivalis]|nr:MAG: hypothetical protein M1814_006936 [Vezdaea aestivalis]
MPLSGRRIPRIWLPLVLGLACFLQPSTSVIIQASDCLDPQTNPHLAPLQVRAALDTQSDLRPLKIMVYGNVTNGIIEKGYGQDQNNLTTLIADLSVLQYELLPRGPNGPKFEFCKQVLGRTCPIGPSLPRNQSLPLDLNNLTAFTFTHNLNSSYAFTTLTAKFTVLGAPPLSIACITANITPDFGPRIASLLAYIPLTILILSGAATIFAAIYSPWGTSDVFRWSSNYGRDEDLLRLVTPGFGDCLQYIQFIVLTGSLSLNYPGFYQPAVSQASWSTLMFNRSFVSGTDGINSLEDGIYFANGTFGLDRMRQYVGLEKVEDMWAGMIIWLLVILAAVVFLIEVGFIIRWIYRQIADIPEEDLRAKNFPFAVGNVIRIVFNYFLLPTVALSMLQLVETGQSKGYITAMASLVLLLLVCFSAWVLKVIVTTRPRSHLFDDLPTVLLYGPLYNTYSDGSTAFALIPVFLTFIRGIAIGAVQPSGVAQVVLLAICEVVLILTLVTFKPFQSPTSMNVYHTFFSIIRLITTLLSILFVPSLRIPESSKGWVGYVILLMHAIALVFGFFLNSIQTLVEVAVRLAGAGGDGNNTTRGGLVKVFGKRQLSRRLPQRGSGRQSALSGNMTVSSANGRKSSQLNGRARSFSGSSAKLLGRASDGRASVGLENMSAAGGGHQRAGSSHSPFTPSTPGAGSTFSQFGGNQGGILGLNTAEAGTPYYRPPRHRRPTEKFQSPAAKTRGSWASGDWMSGNPQPTRQDSDRAPPMELGEGPSISGRATPVPPFASSQQYPSDSNINEQDRPDYAVREVDFYYRVRGPALNTLQTRRLGTGPADPTGPVASATGWIKGLFGGKTKDKGKGFEVVRSSRMPPAMLAAKSSQEVSTADPAEAIGVATTRDLDLSIPASNTHLPQPHDNGDVSPVDNDLPPSHDPDISSDEDSEPRPRISNLPPTLPSINTGGDIELPTRNVSNPSSAPLPRSGRLGSTPPSVPRKSSKRGTSHSPAGSAVRLAGIDGTPPPTPPQKPTHHLHPSMSSSNHMPFGSDASSVGDVDQNGGSMDSRTSVGEGLTSPRAVPGEEIRPASVGYVSIHHTSDNIHRMNSRDRSKVRLEGSQAELVVVDADGEGHGAAKKRMPLE